MQPLVSICCISYNQSTYIRQCIEGFLFQKCNFNYEIIIHDDASTDDTRLIIEDYCKKYPGLFTPIFQDENQYSKGIKPIVRFVYPRARGKYIALCEGDDYWTDPYKLQKQVDFLEANPEYIASFHNVKVETDIKNIHLYSDFSWNGIDLKRDVYTMKDVIASPLMPTCSILFRNTLQLPFPEWTTNCMSGDMVLAMLITKNFKIKFFNECWGVYRKHSGGITITHSGDKINANRIYLYLRMLEHYHYSFKEDFKKVIKKHLQSLSALSSLSKEDQKIIFKLMPIAYLKVKLKSK
jgi:glycosyltransferase involved in cell wall biosynthesis